MNRFCLLVLSVVGLQFGRMTGFGMGFYHTHFFIAAVSYFYQVYLFCMYFWNKMPSLFMSL